jgi:hypothetical protein
MLTVNRRTGATCLSSPSLLSHHTSLLKAIGKQGITDLLNALNNAIAHF